MTVTVLRNEIAAMLLFAGTGDKLRWQICGVQCELTPGTTPLLVATDGRRIAILKSQGADHNVKAGSVFLPRSAINAALAVPSKNCYLLRFTVRRKQIRATGTDGSDRLFSLVIGNQPNQEDIAFPKWRQCVPTINRETPCVSRKYAFNPAYVGDYAKAAKILAGPTGSRPPYGITMDSGDSLKPIVVRISSAPNFISVLMPLHSADDEVDALPEWLDIKTGDTAPPPTS